MYTTYYMPTFRHTNVFSMHLFALIPIHCNVILTAAAAAAAATLLEVQVSSTFTGDAYLSASSMLTLQCFSWAVTMAAWTLSVLHA